MNSRGCARHERTPGNGDLDARHPSGVVPSPRAVNDLVENPSGVRECCGGGPGVSLVPRSTPGYSR